MERRSALIGDGFRGWDMALSAWLLSASVLMSVLVQEERTPEEQHIVLFDRDRARQESTGSTRIFAHQLCLKYGCSIRHIYGAVPGMAIEGGRITNLLRASGVSSVHADAEVRFEADSARLVGAPPNAPLAYIGPGLDAETVPIEREVDYLRSKAASGDLMTQATLLVAAYAERSPNSRFWSMRVIDEKGSGVLSDVLAALDFLLRYRYSLGAVYMPLRMQGGDTAPMCRFVDAALQRGLLVLSSMDATCPLEPFGNMLGR